MKLLRINLLFFAIVTVLFLAGSVLDRRPAAATGVGRHAGQTVTVRIREIQGKSHLSPLVDQTVSAVGIVTVKRATGFFMQDPEPDTDPRTSEGIFVFGGTVPANVAVGDHVSVNGVVAELRGGQPVETNANLTVTQLNATSFETLSHGNPLPEPVVVGTGGRVPPSAVIDADLSGNIETGGNFDPTVDAIDFYESLEGMLVRINNPVVVGPTETFRNGTRELVVIGDNGMGAGARTPRGGIIVRPNDFNPERIVLNSEIAALPEVNVRDRFRGSVDGVMDYGFGVYKLVVTKAPTVSSGGLMREVTTPAGPGILSVAAFNVENLDPNDDPTKFKKLAALIVQNLRSPDLISVEEIQDNNGPTDDGTVDASQTFARLIDAIRTAGGPVYDHRSIDPVNNQDGGETGGNIRIGFLFRTDRGLKFIDRTGGTATAPTTVLRGPAGPELSFSPGRIAPGHGAWNRSRKPLAGEFTFRGQRLFVIANHFASKGGDQPLFGRFQPPARISEVQREQQAQLVNGFVNALMAADPRANVIVMGDLNDFEFSCAVNTLKGGVLTDLIETLPPNERYTYVFGGNSQTLDHILVTGNLRNRLTKFDVVHVNAEFHDQTSDHDPTVAQFRIGPR